MSDRKKVVLYLDSANALYGIDGSYIGMLTGAAGDYQEPSSSILELVKQGLTADDLVKLKNMDII